jgi:hypothetical protein
MNASAPADAAQAGGLDHDRESFQTFKALWNEDVKAQAVQQGEQTGR